MIVRERANDFVMIEQDNHAQISGEMISNWRDDLFRGERLRSSVDYAIVNHDYGWKAFDEQPFWNDQKQTPYTFIDFPTPSKVMLYRSGINAVERHDNYAALMCSEHYTRFLLNDNSTSAKTFVQQEKERQQHIIASFSDYDKVLFDFHYGLLQLCDNLSLYICLNEPNVKNKHGHPFFRKGIPLSSELTLFGENKIRLSWIDENTIIMSEFPFKKPLTVTIKQKIIGKKEIMDKGLINAYQASPFQQFPIQLTPHPTT